MRKRGAEMWGWRIRSRKKTREESLRQEEIETPDAESRWAFICDSAILLHHHFCHPSILPPTLRPPKDTARHPNTHHLHRGDNPLLHHTHTGNRKTKTKRGEAEVTSCHLLLHFLLSSSSFHYNILILKRGKKILSAALFGAYSSIFQHSSLKGTVQRCQNVVFARMCLAQLSTKTQSRNNSQRL